MAEWEAYYYETEERECYIRDFILGLNNKNRAKTLDWIDKLEEKGPLLTRPMADLLKDGIHELRIKLSGRQNRILYFFYFQDMIILTHVFIKKSKEVPIKEIKKAKKIREDFLKRFPTKEDFLIFLRRR